MKTDNVYSCCRIGTPNFLITFSVAGEQKTYRVCKRCNNLECFQKFTISKISIGFEAV